MSDGLEFYFPVVPVPKGRPRTTRSGVTYTPKETREAERMIKYYARCRYHSAPIEGELEIGLVFNYEKPKRAARAYPPRHDLDNLVKLVCDALNELVWKDDKQITKIVAEKRYHSSPGILLTIKTR